MSEEVKSSTGNTGVEIDLGNGKRIRMSKKIWIITLAVVCVAAIIFGVFKLKLQSPVVESEVKDAVKKTEVIVPAKTEVKAKAVVVPAVTK